MEKTYTQAEKELTSNLAKTMGFEFVIFEKMYKRHPVFLAYHNELDSVLIEDDDNESEIEYLMIIVEKGNPRIVSDIDEFNEIMFWGIRYE